jgi:hypothetical protein
MVAHHNNLPTEANNPTTLTIALVVFPANPAQSDQMVNVASEPLWSAEQRVVSQVTNSVAEHSEQLSEV